MSPLSQAGSPRIQRPAFTLLELVLSLVIATAVFGLVMAGIMKIRCTAARSDCQNRMRNLVTAIFTYEAREGRLPPGSISGPYLRYKVPENVNHSIWATLLDPLEQPAAAAAYHWDVNYDDPRNQTAVKTQIPSLLCPSLSSSRVEQWTDGRSGGVADYAPVDVNPILADFAQIGSSENFEGALPVNGTVRLPDVTDGTGNTILIAEAAGRPGMAWSSPSIPVSIKQVRGGASHQGGANVAFCDGSIRFLKASNDLKLLAKLATRAGNESLSDDW